MTSNLPHAAPGEVLAALKEAYRMFVCTQLVDEYPADHWSRTARQLFPDVGQ